MQKKFFFAADSRTEQLEAAKEEVLISAMRRRAGALDQAQFVVVAWWASKSSGFAVLSVMVRRIVKFRGFDGSLRMLTLIV